jgi:hypothetical protein
MAHGQSIWHSDSHSETHSETKKIFEGKKRQRRKKNGQMTDSEGRM